MTIKQQGGIFGRNPTFNDVTVEGTLTTSGASEINGDLTVDGDLTVNGDNGTAAYFDASTNDFSLYEDTGVDQKLFWDASTESLAIGTTSTSYGQLNLYKSGANDTKLALANNGNGGGTVAWTIKNDTAWDLTISHNAGIGGQNLIFGTKNSGGESARFNTSGNLAFPSGQGIDFSATSGSGTSELFDDYEEGTFSPFFKTTNDDMGSTGFARIGYYTKIGNVCHVGFYLFSTSLTSAGTGDLIIDGLPFNSAASVQHSLSVSRSSRFGSNPPITAAVAPSDNYIILFSTPHTTASTPTETAASDLNVSGGNQNIIYVAGSYTVA